MRCMGEVREFLEEHLRPMAGPYLFVGAGFSRRYADLPSWSDLLERFSEPTGMPLGYYQSGSLPEAASKLAEAFHEVWWKSDDFKESVVEWESQIEGDRALPLKIEIAKFLASEIEGFDAPAALKDEWELLQQATVDGVITTNYDDLLSVAFPEYRIYVGQEGLLFSDPQGIAEIYAIHGTGSNPASLVLTQEDYEIYEARDTYLAAKLMTVFVEHPVIFLGYSFSDPNIHQTLKSLVGGLRERSFDKLQDRLVFIEWVADDEPTIQRTQLNIDGQLLPVIRITVPDWRDVFSALGNRKHALNARTLRVLKEQVYEIVRTNDPTERLFAYRDIDDDNADDISVVFGVGAKVATVGLVGLKRDEVQADVLQSQPGGFPAEEMLRSHIASVTATTWYPIYKYLREAGHLDDQGAIIDPESLDERLIRREEKNRTRIVEHVRYRRRYSVAELVERHDWKWIFKEILELPSHTHDVEGLRDFLLRFPEPHETSPWYGTQHAKGVVVFDFMKYRLPGG